MSCEQQQQSAEGKKSSLKKFSEPSLKRRRITFAEDEGSGSDQNEENEDEDQEDNNEDGDDEDDDGEINWNKLEEALEKNAAKANLTAVNVKSILHHILSDKRVIEYAKNVKATPETLKETKLTRSKAKLFGQDPLYIPTQPENTQPKILDLEFSESSDEEYNPQEDEVLSQASEDDGNSLLNDSCCSYTASTPGGPEDDEPEEVKKSIPEKTADVSPQIALRTRSRCPMPDIEVEEIEAMFNPPDSEALDFSVRENDDADEAIWKSWLSDFMKPIKALQDNDEQDEDFNYMAEEEDIEMEEELRDDRATRITQKELQELFNELLLGSSVENVEEETTQPTHDPYSNVDECLQISIEQRQRIFAQLQQHTQLLTTVHIMSKDNELLKGEAELSKQYIEELNKLNNKAIENATFDSSSINPLFSAFCTPGISEAYRIVKEVEGKHLPSVKKVGKKPTGRMCVGLAEVFSKQRYYATYPELLPQRTMRHEASNKRPHFCVYEDNLLVLGLDQFKRHGKYNDISRYLLPNKSPEQLRARVKNILMRQEKNNPIFRYKRESSLPDTSAIDDIVIPRAISQVSLLQLPSRFWTVEPPQWFTAHKRRFTYDLEEEDRKKLSQRYPDNKLYTLKPKMNPVKSESLLQPIVLLQRIQHNSLPKRSKKLRKSNKPRKLPVQPVNIPPVQFEPVKIPPIQPSNIPLANVQAITVPPVQVLPVNIPPAVIIPPVQSAPILTVEPVVISSNVSPPQLFAGVKNQYCLLTTTSSTIPSCTLTNTKMFPYTTPCKESSPTSQHVNKNSPRNNITVCDNKLAESTAVFKNNSVESKFGLITPVKSNCNSEFNTPKAMDFGTPSDNSQDSVILPKSPPKSEQELDFVDNIQTVVVTAQYNETNNVIATSEKCLENQLPNVQSVESNNEKNVLKDLSLIDITEFKKLTKTTERYKVIKTDSVDSSRSCDKEVAQIFESPSNNNNAPVFEMKPLGLSPKATRKVAKAKRRVFNYAEKRKEKSRDFADIYLKLVRDTLIGKPVLWNSFYGVMASLGAHELTTLDAYKRITVLFVDFPHLVDHFVGFLDQHEARDVGKFLQWLCYEQVIEFHLRCEEAFNNTPGWYHKIIHKIIEVTDETRDSREIVEAVSPLFKGHIKLAHLFIKLFPDLSPPPCEDDDFEVIDFGAVTSGARELDDFEEIQYQQPEENEEKKKPPKVVAKKTKIKTQVVDLNECDIPKPNNCCDVSKIELTKPNDVPETNDIITLEQNNFDTLPNQFCALKTCDRDAINPKPCDIAKPTVCKIAELNELDTSKANEIDALELNDLSKANDCSVSKLNEPKLDHCGISKPSDHSISIPTSSNKKKSECHEISLESNEQFFSFDDELKGKESTDKSLTCENEPLLTLEKPDKPCVDESTCNHDIDFQVTTSKSIVTTGNQNSAMTSSKPYAEERNFCHQTLTFGDTLFGEHASKFQHAVSTTCCDEMNNLASKSYKISNNSTATNNEIPNNVANDSRSKNVEFSSNLSQSKRHVKSARRLDKSKLITLSTKTDLRDTQASPVTVAAIQPLSFKGGITPLKEVSQACGTTKEHRTETAKENSLPIESAISCSLRNNSTINGVIIESRKIEPAVTNNVSLPSECVAKGDCKKELNESTSLSTKVSDDSTIENNSVGASEALKVIAMQPTVESSSLKETSSSKEPPVFNWTKNEDMVILSTIQTSGDGEETLNKIQSLLGRTMEQVEERYRYLMQMIPTLKNESESEESDSCSEDDED